MSKWQPIETAPKDGTPVDLWCVNEVDAIRIEDGSHPVGVRLTDCWWEGEWMRLMDDGYWDPVEGEPGGAYGLPPWTPTHWMPLPEPPATLTRKEDE